MATFDFWNIVRLGARLVVRGFNTPIGVYLFKCGLLATLTASLFAALTTFYSSYVDLMPGDIASSLFSMLNGYDSNIGPFILSIINIETLCSCIYVIIQMTLAMIVGYFTFMLAFAIYMKTTTARMKLAATQWQLANQTT